MKTKMMKCRHPKYDGPIRVTEHKRYPESMLAGKTANRSRLNDKLRLNKGSKK